MTHAIDAARIALTVSAFLYILLGAWVLTLRPQRRQTTLLGAFSVVFGLQFATTNVLQLLHLMTFGSLEHALVLAPLSILAYSLAFALAWSLPEPLENRRPLGIALVLGGGLGLVYGGSFPAIGQLPGGGPGTETAVWVWSLFFASFGILWGAAVLLALRARPGRGADRGAVTQFALLAVALSLLHAFDAGSGLASSAAALASGDPALLLRSAATLVPWLLVGGLWGWRMVRSGEDTRGIQRTAMLGILGVLAAGAVYFAAVPSANPGSNLMRGVVRTLGVGLLAYGILRHDIAGLDAKVEFGVSKTTVAGIFVAVFFIVSEGAQALFADFAGNEFLGVLAAGALVFAISPLQRVADRFAAKAVPGGAAGPSDAGQAEASYRRAVQATLADGEITEDEEEHLAELVDELEELSSARAYEIRREVEDEVREG